MFHCVHTFIVFKQINLGRQYISQKLKKHAHFKIPFQDEVFTGLFFFSSSRDETSSTVEHASIQRLCKCRSNGCVSVELTIVQALN